MVFGGLSEKEVEKISQILEESNIEFNVVMDNQMMDINDESMQYNLRHLNSPSISTDILAIEITTESFENMNEETANKLLDFGITNQVPEELEVDNDEPEAVQKQLITGNMRIIGHNFVHQLLLMAGAFVFYLLFKLVF